MKLRVVRTSWAENLFLNGCRCAYEDGRSHNSSFAGETCGAQQACTAQGLFSSGEIADSAGPSRRDEMYVDRHLWKAPANFFLHLYRGVARRAVGKSCVDLYTIPHGFFIGARRSRPFVGGRHIGDRTGRELSVGAKHRALCLWRVGRRFDFTNRRSSRWPCHRQSTKQGKKRGKTEHSRKPNQKKMTVTSSARGGHLTFCCLVVQFCATFRLSKHR